jgi:hypothetical protein
MKSCRLRIVYVTKNKHGGNEKNMHRPEIGLIAAENRLPE